MEERINIRRYAQEINNNYDDGERQVRLVTYVEPRQIYDATDALVNAQERKVLFIQLPFYSDRFLNLSHELLQSIRNVRHLPCTWFFGSNRLFQVRHSTLQAKLVSLVSSMIVQLIDLLPRRFHDPEMVLSQEVFNSLHLYEPRHTGIAIDIPVAIRIIKALVNVIPRGILFFFEGCDDLASVYHGPLDEVFVHFGDLIHFLTQPEPGKPRRILWIEAGEFASFVTMISGLVRIEDYTLVQYPRDWNDGMGWEGAR
ncbi:hypothetical protein F4805DRAFT_463256 [Annulohypoxylon moriforme]|nr:hypothetical protein F4805DRAFT_463256 [Annulohypoxylon moriforme]